MQAQVEFYGDFLIQKYSPCWFNIRHHQATGKSLVSDPPHPHDVDISEDVNFPEIEMITTNSLLLEEEAPTNLLGEDKYDDDKSFLARNDSASEQACPTYSSVQQDFEILLRLI